MQLTLSLEPRIQDKSLASNIVLVDYDNDYMFIEALRTATSVAFDIETYSTEADDKDNIGGLRWWKSHIRLLQFMVSDLVYIVDTHKYNVDNLVPHIKRVLEDTQVPIMCHNGKFEYCSMVHHYGIRMNNVADTMIMSQLLNGGLLVSNALGAVASRELDITLDKSWQLFNWGTPELPSDAITYAVNDVLILPKLAEVLQSKLAANGLSKIARIEMANVSVFGDMETNGFPVDIAMIDEQLKVFTAKASEAAREFNNIVPGVSITATKKTLVPIFNTLFGYTPDTVGDAELALYADQPVVKALRNYRSLKKSIDYLNGMKQSCRNGRVFTSYTQLNPAGFGRTSSGKFHKKATSSDGINLQQCPKAMPNMPNIRKCFRAPVGKKLIICDLSSAHARFAIEFSQDPVGISVYKSNRDIHLVTALRILAAKSIELSYDEITAIYKDKSHKLYTEVKIARDQAKPTLYQSINLAGWARIQATAASQGLFMSDNDAQNASMAFKETYAGLVSYQRTLLNVAKNPRNMVTTDNGQFAKVISKCGRISHVKCLPDRFHPDRLTPMAANVVSFAWTAVEATIMKLALALCRVEFRNHPEWEAELVNFTHDEINAICNDRYALDVSKFINDTMTNNMRRFTPSIAGCLDRGDDESSVCTDLSEK